MTRRQHERLLDVGSAGFDIITATDVSELATCGDFTAIPALEIVSVVEIGVERECHYKQDLTAKFWQKKGNDYTTREPRASA